MTKTFERTSATLVRKEKRKQSGQEDDERFEEWFPLSMGMLFRQTSRFVVTLTVVLYILNQKHLLPKRLGRAVSKALFWPTLPITFSTRLGKWITEVDEAVVMGGAPFGFMGYPRRLKEEYGVSFPVLCCFV